MALELVKILLEKNLTLSSIESFTGGNFSHNITSIPSTSKIFLGGLVLYSNSSKQKIMKTSLKEDYYSKEFATSMLNTIQQYFQSNISISFTGIAGPTKPENTQAKIGDFFISIKINKKIYEYEFSIIGNRVEIIEKATKKGIDLIKNLINMIFP